MADIDPLADDLPAPRTPLDDDADPEPPRAGAREGLPPRYRMRADRHYVDLLSSQASPRRDRSLPVSTLDAPAVSDVPALVPLIDSVRQHGILQPLLVQEHEGRTRVIDGRRRLAAAIAAGLREVPCCIHAVDDAAAARLREAAHLTQDRHAPDASAQAAPAPAPADEDIARGLTTAAGLADLMAEPLTDLSRGAIGLLMRAELWRTASLQQAARLVREERPAVRAVIALPAMIDRVVRGFEPERRLRHVDIVVTSEVPPAHLVLADEKLLSAALTAALISTLALVEGLAAARVTIVAGVTPARGMSLAVMQEHVRPAAAWLERAFDPSWTDRPGGLAAAVSMAAVRRVALAHGGDAIAVGTARGSRVALTIPAGA